MIILKIKIVDSICGSGKTSSMINMMENDKSENRYIYITPFLTEVERIKKSCTSRKFYEPKFNSSGNKFDNLNKLIQENKEGLVRHSSHRVARAVYCWYRKSLRK